MALWFFQRVAPGEIKRISVPSMQRFLTGERKLIHDGDKFVRCIGMSVELHNRKPATVARVWFSKIPVLADGTIDPEHRQEVIKIASGDEALTSVRDQPGTAVIGAEHRFARRRLGNLAEWRPEQADVDALRTVVNSKAGREML